MNRILISKEGDCYLTALTQGGRLIELIRDCPETSSIVGNIYAGVIKKINSGFIFLDIGYGKQAFLDTRDFRERRLFDKDTNKLCHAQGDTLIVQILRDAIGQKGPVATSEISHAGRYVVLTKSFETDRISMSKRLSQDDASTLKAIAKSCIAPGFSAIVRTEAAIAKKEDIETEFKHLASKFDEVKAWNCIKGPATLFEEPGIVKTIREISSKGEIDEIVANDWDVCNLAKDHAPNTHLYQDPHPIMSHYYLSAQIDKINQKRVWLNSGAFIVIEQTEACVVIDVNSGKLISKNANALKINMEAAKEIAYQIRLRNLSGIIIIDFIEMQSKENASRLTEFLRQEVAKDRISTIVIGMTTLGLMEMTRKRGRSPYNAMATT